MIVKVKLEVDASDARPTQNMERPSDGWDVDVELVVGGEHYDGEVTLANDADEPVRFGNPDHWISGELLRKLRGFPKDLFAEVLREMEEAAAIAIEENL